MKSLGATIDLERNTCFMKTLNRSLPLRENQNGLFMISMSDLCQSPQEQHEAAFHISSSQPSVPPGLNPLPETHDANTTGSVGSTSIGVGGSAHLPSPPVLHAFQHDESRDAERTSLRAGDGAHPTADLRSQESTGKDPRTVTSDFEPVHTIQSALSSEPNNDSDSNGGWRLVGTRRNGRDPRDDAKYAKRFQCSGARYFPSDALPANESVYDSSSACSSDRSSHQDCWNARQWSPINQSWGSQSARPCRDGSQSSCSDPDSTGNLGSKDGHMGAQTQRANICSSLRDRRRVCQVGHGSRGKPERGDGGLLQLCHHTTSPRDHGTAEREVISEWQPMRESRWQLVQKCKPSQHVHDAHEGGWIKEMYKLAKRGGNQCKQIDLLEVYAYPQSQLTEVASKCGLKATRDSH